MTGCAACKSVLSVRLECKVLAHSHKDNLYRNVAVVYPKSVSFPGKPHYVKEKMSLSNVAVL